MLSRAIDYVVFDAYQAPDGQDREDHDHKKRKPVIKIRESLPEYGISEAGYDPGHRIEVQEKVKLLRYNGGRKKNRSEPYTDANDRHDDLLEVAISDSQHRHPDGSGQTEADIEKQKKGQ